MDTLFNIKSPLLLDAFFGNAQCIKNCSGYLYEDKNHLGRSFIEFCMARIFKIHRLPGFESFYVRNVSSNTLRKAYRSLKIYDVDLACEELKQLYLFTQEKLQHDHRCHDGKIKLVRALRDYEVKEVSPQLINDTKSIMLPVNIINSYSYDQELFCYDSNISILREVEISKIAFVDRYIQKPNGICGHSLLDCEHEAWVLEDDIFGKINLDLSCFHVKNQDKLLQVREMHHTYESNRDYSLFKTSETSCLPCEFNSFTKFIINRNKKIISRLNTPNN